MKVGDETGGEIVALDEVGEVSALVGGAVVGAVAISPLQETRENAQIAKTAAKRGSRFMSV